ncbi:hypothetical protein [Microvirga puerhi]|uniref:DUF3830 family protein n=1 Tax=Microvirga puerhi TaxID=2876078 RepID=A0ABS7VKG4_9HYPH|nr:hypothetical protein [Microvirga puerhi]MBZ6075714.1 hypothetical protein [Microvirga puerhi]
MNAITIAGERFDIDVLGKWAPKTVATLQEIGRIDLDFVRSSWCGPVLHATLDSGPVLEIGEVEQPVISLYPGIICLRPVERRNSTYQTDVWARLPQSYSSTVEFVVAFGHGEFRGPIGPSYVTPFGRITNFGPEVAAHLENVSRAGQGAGALTINGDR